MNDLYLIHKASKSKYKGGFITKNGRLNNSKAYNHDYYIKNKEKWNNEEENILTENVEEENTIPEYTQEMGYFERDVNKALEAYKGNDIWSKLDRWLGKDIELALIEAKNTRDFWLDSYRTQMTRHQMAQRGYVGESTGRRITDNSYNYRQNFYKPDNPTYNGIPLSTSPSSIKKDFENMRADRDSRYSHSISKEFHLNSKFMNAKVSDLQKAYDKSHIGKFNKFVETINKSVSSIKKKIGL